MGENPVEKASLIPPSRLHSDPATNTTPPFLSFTAGRHKNFVSERLAHLLKLTAEPPGPLRTVMPEVPVEPVALGAGLG